MPKLYVHFGFSLIELMVVIAIVAMAVGIAIPMYTENIKTANVTKMVNKLGTFKLDMIDTYSANNTWPASVNGVNVNNTGAENFFDDAVNFRYQAADDTAWIGYKLSADYGSGWVFMVLIANPSGVFATHCGSIDNTCTFGYCNSLSIYPSSCAEENLGTTFGF